MSDVTRILNAIEEGDHRAVDELLPVVYEELRCRTGGLLLRRTGGRLLSSVFLCSQPFLPI